MSGKPVAYVTKSFIKLQNTSPPGSTRRALRRRAWHIHPPQETKEFKCAYPQANHTRHGLIHWTQQPKQAHHSHCHSLSSKSRSVQQCRQNHLCYSKTLSLFAIQVQAASCGRAAGETLAELLTQHGIFSRAQALKEHKCLGCQVISLYGKNLEGSQACNYRMAFCWGLYCTTSTEHCSCDVKIRKTKTPRGSLKFYYGCINGFFNLWAKQGLW